MKADFVLALIICVTLKKQIDNAGDRMKKEFHEEKVVGLLLTFVGGALDAYTFAHYDVFASAQTGNMILGIIAAFEGNWQSVAMKSLSALFFILGILLTKYLIDFFAKKRLHFWRLFVLYFEAHIFFGLSFTVINQHQSLVSILVAFTAAIQWVAFDKIDGKTYTNLFTTGNMKSMTTSFYDFMKTKNPQDKSTFLHYLRVVLAFISGAILSIYVYRLFGGQGILMVAFILLGLALYETFQVVRFIRETHYIKK